MHLIPDLKEFIELLNSENVRYLVIGGWAFNRYAEPRFTGDLDFFVAVDSENQGRIRKALVRFGFASVLPPEAAPLFEKKILMLGRPPNRIDLLREISGVEFEQAWKDRQGGSLDGLPVNFISCAHLIQNKRAAAREKDLADVKILERLEKIPSR